MSNSNSVRIKASGSGITLVLDAETDWDTLKEDIRKKFSDDASFWGNVKKAISFQGRKISEEQQNEILAVIEESCDLQIVCVLDDDPSKEARFAKALEASRTPSREELMNSENGENTGFFFKGNLRSGQLLDVESSIIILGDVNAGAKVVSKGNVIILGSLKGNVFAGSAGNVDAFVIALDMEPVQIRIADTIARSPDEQKKKKKTSEIKIAFWEDGNIYIEPLDKSVLNDIRLS